MWSEYTGRTGAAAAAPSSSVQTGAPISVENGFRIALLGRTPGGSNLQSINELDDIALAAVGVQVVGVVLIGELGGAYLASESGIAATEALRRMGVNIVANKRLLLVQAYQLRLSLSGGSGLAAAYANSANTTIYPAWLLARGAAAAGPATVTAIID